VKSGGSDDGGGLAEPSAIGADPAAAVELKGEVARLLAALEELPAPVQSAFLRFHRDGATLHDISEELDIPLNTVKSHLRRARLRLAARLGERPSDGSP
jgi:RNA polymerase sigma-70 factor (ECF subfamily)